MPTNSTDAATPSHPLDDSLTALSDALQSRRISAVEVMEETMRLQENMPFDSRK